MSLIFIGKHTYKRMDSFLFLLKQSCCVGQFALEFVILLPPHPWAAIIGTFCQSWLEAMHSFIYEWNRPLVTPQLLYHAMRQFIVQEGPEEGWLEAVEEWPSQWWTQADSTVTSQADESPDFYLHKLLPQKLCVSLIIYPSFPSDHSMNQHFMTFTHDP